MAAAKTINYNLINGLAIFAFIVLALTVIIIGRPVLMPVALAVLFTFILTPVVSVLEKLGIGRVAAVCVLVACLGVCLAALVSMAFLQANELLANLPNYWEKTQSYVNTYVKDESMFSRLWMQVQNTVEPGIEGAAESAGATSSPLIGGASGTTWLTSIPSVLGSIFAPLANTAAVVVLTIFMLILREDIRNRFIGALGESRLLNATRVMNDTSDRLSKYLFGLFSVNFGFSVVLTLGLFLLGVPYALVWGIVSFFFRFIPYLGSTLSMLLPLVTSIIAQQSWFAAIGVVALYVALEFTTGNFIEPNLFGNSVGMNPVALLIALMFWAWAWGTIGLAMAVPMTVIIVTLGRHLACFSSLEKLAGNSDPMPPHVVVYQRLLSNDLEEPRAILNHEIAESSLSHAVENTIMRTLSLARAELRSQKIGVKDARDLELNARNLITEYTVREQTDAPDDAVSVVKSGCHGYRGLALACCNESAVIGLLVSTAAADMVEWEVLEDVNSTSLNNALERKPDVVVIAGAPPTGLTPILKMCRRLRRLGFDGKIIAGYWRRRPLTRQSKRLLIAAGADFYSHRIWTISRLLSHLDALRDVEEESTSVEAAEVSGLLEVQ